MLLQLKRVGVVAACLLLGAAVAWASTALTPPAMTWGSMGPNPTTPVSIIGYDSGTGLPCIAGQTATCKVAISGSGSSSEVTQGTTPWLVSVGTAGRIDVTPTVQNAAYSSGNDIGGLIALTLPRTASGYIQSVSVKFIGGATTQVNVFLFDSNPSSSTFTDKSTFTIATADVSKQINKLGLALTPAAVVGETATAATIDNYAKPFNATGTIYMAIAATALPGALTPASTTDMRVSISYEQKIQ